jgi:single-strand DNA-binding protein
MMNRWTGSCRLVADPKLTLGENGETKKNRVWFKGACEDHFSPLDENGKHRVDFINFVAWGRTADNIAEYCKKGKMVYPSGRLRCNSKQRPDGTYDNYTEVTIEEIEFGANAQKNRPQQDTNLSGLNAQDMKTLADLIAKAKTAGLGTPAPAPDPQSWLEADPFTSTASA